MVTMNTKSLSQSYMDFVSKYYGAGRYHQWLTDQYPLLNISDKRGSPYQLLAYATLERNLTEEMIVMS